MAMSAATMLACAADQIVMGNHSFIGPIDPQLQLQTNLGVRTVAAQAITQQFDMAKTESANAVALRARLPMLTQYGPDLLATCLNASDLSKALVSEWLTNYMFRNDPNAASKANDIADWLGSHSIFKTHGRPISRAMAEQHDLNIVALESDQALQDAVLSVYHATALTFASTGAVKIIENHLGKSIRGCHADDDGRDAGAATTTRSTAATAVRRLLHLVFPRAGRIPLSKPHNRPLD